MKFKTPKSKYLIVGGALGVLAIGGLVALSSGGSASGGGQSKALVRPGYTILPNCNGIEVTDEAKALAYARQVARDAKTRGWAASVDLALYGPVCGGITPSKWQQIVKANGRFLYQMLRAVLRGAIDAGVLSESQADDVLADTRKNFASAGVANDDLMPVTVS